MVKKKNQWMTTIIRSLLTARTFKCHLILSLTLIIPIQKGGSHKRNVAVFGYKI
jgi:hypothetical protein